MFTGIIEDLGVVKHIKKDLNNLHFTIKSELTPELKIDQSVSHNGICLTVVDLKIETYTVTAIKETLDKTNLTSLKINDTVNLERSLKLGDRLDGHIVQGHVDQIGTCINVEEENGSWLYTFEYDDRLGNITIEKGSITINGVSLTVVNSRRNILVLPLSHIHTYTQISTLLKKVLW